ncbi:MAG: asparagine synthase-related protein [Thermoplasmata archaeon]|nr:asparagine synthase-related protein [Thermoplasmata archaeon]
MEIQNLICAIRESVRDTIGSQKAVAVAYSGGLDSSVVARVAGESSEVVCYTAAFPGSHDHGSAVRFAEEEGAALEMIMLDAENLEHLVIEAGRALRSADPIRISYTVPIMSVIEASREDLVLVGSGADELFGGYSKYSSMADPTNAMTADFEKALHELSMLDAAARTRGKRVGAPFASSSLREIADGIPIADKVSGERRKIVLREVAKELGLASHSRPKKAAQYSSGVLKEMRRAARVGGVDLSAWTEKMLRQ